MADVVTVVSNIDIARESAEESEYASSIAYYESALALLSKHVRNVSDPNVLGKLREVQKRANTEMELVRELNNEVLMISGGSPAGPGPGRGHDVSQEGACAWSADSLHAVTLMGWAPSARPVGAACMCLRV
jgi:hypothetical protein